MLKLLQILADFVWGLILTSSVQCSGIHSKRIFDSKSMAQQLMLLGLTFTQAFVSQSVYHVKAQQPPSAWNIMFIGKQGMSSMFLFFQTFYSHAFHVFIQSWAEPPINSVRWCNKSVNNIREADHDIIDAHQDLLLTKCDWFILIYDRRLTDWQWFL